MAETVKLFHFNSTQGKHWMFRRVPKQLEWHIWTGAHIWVVQFACKCNACKVKRIMAFWAKFGVKLSYEDFERSGRPAIRQAITQLRFRESWRKS